MANKTSSFTKKKLFWVVLLLIILLLIVWLIFSSRFLSPPSNSFISPTPSLSPTPQDDWWIPDAVSQSEDYIIESKFDLR